MPRPRFNKLPQERREQILDVAAREFAAHGFEKASLNHVLGAAGLSKGAAYYYFDDKADLFAAVVERYLVRYVIYAEPVTAQSPDEFWEWVYRMYRRSMNQFRETPWMLGLAKAMWKVPRSTWFGGRFGEVFRWAIDWMRGILRTAQRIGAVRTDLPEDMLIELIMAVDDVGDRWVGEHWCAGENDDEVIDMMMRIWDAVRRMLTPPPEPLRAPGPIEDRKLVSMAGAPSSVAREPSPVVPSSPPASGSEAAEAKKPRPRRKRISPSHKEKRR